MAQRAELLGASVRLALTGLAFGQSPSAPGGWLLGASLRLALTGLALGQSPSAPGGWVGDCETSMVVAM